MKDSSLSTKGSRNDKRMKSLTLLLKCLKIMENATFLSNGNQVYMCYLHVYFKTCLLIFYRYLYCVMYDAWFVAFLAW